MLSYKQFKGEQHRGKKYRPTVIYTDFQNHSFCFHPSILSMFHVKHQKGQTDMHILVACEESQRVTEEFRKRGHIAYSCDLLPTSGTHPEWHIQSDVLPLLNGDCNFQTMDGKHHTTIGRWDMIIAFPPCTHLTVSGAWCFAKKRANGVQREGIEFFCQFLKADCERVVIENPQGIISGEYIRKYFPDLCEKYGLPRPYTQKIQPWWFGDNFSKTTCLWIKGLKPLVPEVIEEPEIKYYEWVDKNGKRKRQDLYSYMALRNAKNSTERSIIRSKTFPGIARAMAEQWGKGE